MHEQEVVVRMTERGLRLATGDSTVGGLIGRLRTTVSDIAVAEPGIAADV